VSPRRAALLAAGTILLAVLPIATTILSGEFVGLIPSALQDGPGSPARQAMVRLFLATALLILALRVLGPLQQTLAATLARAVDLHLQGRLMAAVSSPHGIGHLEDPAVLDAIRNAQGVGGEGLHPGDAVRALASLFPSWLQALGSALILLAFHWWLGLFWLAAWPVVLFVLQGEFIRVSQASGVYAAVVRRADYLRDLAIAPAAAKELRIWGLRDWLRGQFDAAWLAALRPAWEARDPGRPLVWAVTLGVLLANLGAFALLATAAIDGDLTLAALAVYTRALLDASAFRAFDDANAHLAHAAVSVPSLRDLERRLAPRQAAADGSGLEARADRGGLPVDAPRDAIRFERVRFRYEGSDVDVLAGMDLQIPAGGSLAIVGANGAGKTTLIKLLCRLYDPSAGRITLDGHDLRDLDPRAWQRRVAAIFQDFVQFHLSARENISLGAPELADDQEALRAAAEKADALDLIESLPSGWDTVLSRQYEGGVELSGGQWQRIALARALFAVAGGSKVLILDEPTASLDVRSEARLYDRFLELTGGLTTILISHRFSTVRRADRICVLADGQVVEQGTHDELLARGGRYAEMFALQAARFVDDQATAAEAVG
jgi:ABC-type multidrug transport system fused ATPase/permease subunit